MGPGRAAGGPLARKIARREWVENDRFCPTTASAGHRHAAQVATDPIRVRTRVRNLRDETPGVGPLWDSSGMARFGYAQVSTRGQKDDSQIDALTAAGCERIWVDKASGKLARRPEWDKCFEYLRRGDEFPADAPTPRPRTSASPRTPASTNAEQQHHRQPSTNPPTTHVEPGNCCLPGTYAIYARFSANATATPKVREGPRDVPFDHERGRGEPHTRGRGVRLGGGGWGTGPQRTKVEARSAKSSSSWGRMPRRMVAPAPKAITAVVRKGVTIMGASVGGSVKNMRTITRM